MPEYRRAFAPGGTFFFTVVTARRRPILIEPAARASLRTAFNETARTRPFTIEAIVLLPDHLHCIWTLPPDDADFSTRWRLIKTMMTRRYLAAGGRESLRNRSRLGHGERGVWQRRSWEHTIRTEDRFIGLCDYIHYNPVKHGYVDCPHAWQYSSFERFVRARRYERSWNCGCNAALGPVDFSDVDALTGE